VDIVFLVFCVYNIVMTHTIQKRRGRPPKSSDKAKAVRLDIRLSEAEKEAFALAAELAGIDLSAWIRERLRIIAKRELQAAGKTVPFYS
jgi:hypothetical protein